MNAEQVIHESLAAFNARDEKKAFSNFASDLVVNHFMPQPIGLEEFIAVNRANLAAFPDWHFEIKQIQTQGDKTTVTVQVSGTHNGPLNVPGMPPVPASGKKVSVPDRFVCTFGNDNKLHQMDFDTPPGGGFIGVMQQLGIQMPGM
ncbi:MAG TPA: ester cyclase [Aggregatilineales bacterium]|nr:ester cyclase [Aggregatilineales bacterium]